MKMNAMWWGLLGGAIVGGLLGEWRGAIVLGFLGWIGGLVVQSANSRDRSSPLHRRPPQKSFDQRVADLEREVLDLRARLERVEKERPGSDHLEGSAQAPGAQALADERGSVPVPPRPAGPEASSPSAGGEDPFEEYRTPSLPPVAPAPTTSGRGSIVDRLLEGNIVAKLGVVILFFGVAFLLKFAYDRGMFPPAMRLAAVGAGAAALAFLGWRVLAKNRTYALILIGGAMGLAYLDVYFALKTFGYLGPAAAFILFALLGIATLALAVRLDARAIAMLGLLGAFLAPPLASTGEGNHVLLFSYYLVLNLVILAASWFRGWRGLNLLGFAFTFIIATVWGYATYRPEHFATTEPFLVAFFLLYLAIPIAFAHRQPPQLRGLVDATLVFGVPLSAALLQFALTRGMGDHVLAWSAGIVAGIYAALAAVFWKRPQMRLLAEAHLALAIVFATVAPYFAFAGYPTFAFWTLEGAAIYWIASRQGSLPGRVFALLLQVAAAIYFIDVARPVTGENAIWNERVVGCSLIAVAASITAYLMHRFRDPYPKMARLEPVLLLWALGWSIAAIVTASSIGWRHERYLAQLAGLTGLLAVVELVARRLQWWAPRRLAFVASLMFVILFMLQNVRSHPLEGWGLAIWPAALAVLYGALWRQDRDGAMRLTGSPAVFGFAIIVATLFLELEHRIAGRGVDWVYALWAFVLASAMAMLAALRKHWPIAAHERAFRIGAAYPLLLMIAIWTVHSLDRPGIAFAGAYLPLANPIELASMLALASAAWLMATLGIGAAIPIAVAGFLFLNAAVLRAVHHWDGVAYNLGAMLGSTVAQASLSLLWTAMALALMFMATRRVQRALWMAGAALLGIVVVKLFVNDLTGTGTVARIVSFIGVGMTMLAIGWLAPVPPRGTAASEGERPNGQ